jgi:CBS domain-containing protein
MPQADVHLEARLHRHRTVQDVMTAPVVTADKLTPYKEIACLLAEHRVSSLPVLADGWQVIGVVSETMLLAAQDSAARRGRAAARRGRARQAPQATLTAAELMTAPPVTIRPDATISAATRMMTTHHVTSLPVTGADQQLIGIVSRRDLLSVFLRPDADITHEIRHLLDQMPLRDPADVIVTVRHGVVTLTGVVRPGPGHHQDPVPAVIQLIWDVDGVVDIADRLGEASSTPACAPASAST